MRTLEAVVISFIYATGVLGCEDGDPDEAGGAAGGPALGDGVLDPSWGGDGSVEGLINGDEAAINGVDVRPDGRIVAAMRIAGTGNGAAPALFRFLPDGVPDPAFGSEGAALVPPGPGPDYLAATLVQPDGKILTAGVLLFEKLTSDYPGASVAVAKDDSIVVGYPLLADGLTRYDIVLERLGPGGAPDASFGDGGRIVHDAADQDHVRALAVQDDGSVLAAGTLGPGALKSAANLTRFRPDGSLDPDFAQGGAYTVADSFSQLNAVRVLPSGGIFVAGETSSSYLAACYLP